MKHVAVAITVAVAVMLAAVGSLVIGAAAPDRRVQQCGAETPGNKVLVTFSLTKANLFWQRFPAALGAPELENDNPAFVVVFDGPYTWFRTGQVFNNVVCVFQDNYPHIYPGVDLTGADLAPN